MANAQNSFRESANGFLGSVQSFGRDAMNSVKGFVGETSGWGVGGMVAGGLLAWVIGNSFLGGGLLGMVGSLMLMPLMAKLGRDFAQDHFAPAVNAAHNRQGAPAQQRSQAVQPAANVASQGVVNNPDTVAIMAAHEAGKIDPARFTYNAAENPSRPNIPQREQLQGQGVIRH